MIEDNTKISWWRYETYTKCPQMYDWKHVKERKSTSPENTVHTIYGLTIQKLMERLCNEKWFLERDLGLSRLLKELHGTIKEQVSQKHVEWILGITQEGIEQEIIAQAGEILKVWNEEGWLKEGTESEKEMVSKWGKIVMGGKIDFVVPDTKQGLILIDGKGGKRKYVNNDQLKWYALAYHVAYGKRPDRLVHFYWREQKASVLRGWGKEEEIRFANEVKENLRRLLGGDTKATPSNEACRFCVFQDQCLEYKAWTRDRWVGEPGAVVKTIDGESQLLL